MTLVSELYFSTRTKILFESVSDDMKEGFTLADRYVDWALKYHKTKDEAIGFIDEEWGKFRPTEPDPVGKELCKALFTLTWEFRQRTGQKLSDTQQVSAA
jgi:hypothetical protein